MISLFVAALPIAEAGGLPSQKGQVDQAAIAKKMKAVHESFVENKGQWNKSATYKAEAPGYDAWLTESGITFDYYRRVDNRIKGHVVQMSYVGGKGTSTIGVGKTNHVSKYMTHSGGMLADARHFREVMRHDVYPGINVRNYFDRDSFRYDFIIDPTANAAEVKLGFTGASSVSIKDGDLKIGTQLGSFGHGKLFAYQMIAGHKKQVPAKFKLLAKNQIGFQVGDYDHSKSLIIDPVVFGTYFGGDDGWDDVRGVVSDTSTASVYFTGSTQSTTFPVTGGPYFVSLKGTRNAFITRLQGDAYNLDYSVFFGGSNVDFGQFIKLDQFGNVWVAGSTTSADFPTNTKGSSTNNPDLFVIRFQKTNGTPVLDPTTNQAIKMIGGSGAEFLNGFDIVPSANPQPGDPVTMVIVGHSSAATTEVPGTFAPGKGFMLRYNYVGGVFLELTSGCGYLGEAAAVDIGGVAVDAAGNAYVAGDVVVRDAQGNELNVDTSTPSGALQFFTTPNAFTGSRLIQKADLWVRKYSPTSFVPVYSVIVGGEKDESIGGTNFERDLTSFVTGSAIAVDTSGNAYITGNTSSVGYPRTRGAYNQNFDGFFHVVVTKISADSSQILYSTSLGTTNNVTPSGIAVDNAGTAYISGLCNALIPNFPAPVGNPAAPNGPTPDQLGTVPIAGNGSDAPVDPNYTTIALPSLQTSEGFLSVLDPTGSTLLYSTYLGGPLDEGMFAPYVDAYGDCWVCGWIESKRFYSVPGTGNPPPTPTSYPASGYDQSSFPAGVITNLAYKPDDQSDGTFETHAGEFGAFANVFPATVTLHSMRDGFLVKFRVGRPVISAVSVTPATIPGGLNQQATVNVTLSSAAPAGGAAVELALTQNNAAATSASFDPNNPVTTLSVVVPAGATSFSAPIPIIYSSPVTSNTQILVQATYEGNFLIAPLEIVPWLQGLTVNPTAVVGGNAVTGTVTLAQPAPTGGITVALAASNSQITVPATVTVPAGQQSQSFPITTIGVDFKTFPTVTASFLGVGLQDQIELDPATLSSFTLSYPAVTGGTTTTGTVTLTGLPGPNFPPVTVGITGNPAGYVINPTTLNFAGTNTATFTIATPVETVAVTRTVVVSQAASQAYGYQAKSLSAQLTVDVSALKTFTVDKNVANPGDTINATIVLTNPADPGGTNVTLTSSNPAIIASTVLNIASGSSHGTLPLSVIDVEVFNPTTVVLTASRGASSLSQTITINESTIALTLSSSTVLGGNSVTGTITLSDPAPAGFVVTVSIPGFSNISVPFNAGDTSETFTINTVAVSADQNVTVTASVGNLTATASLLIQAPSLNTITFSPSSVRGTQTAVCLITLTAPAPAGGAVVTLTTSNANVATIPATVTVPAGKLNYSFTVLVKRVSRPLATSVTATFNSQTASALLTALR